MRNIVDAMTGWYEVALENGFRPLEETSAVLAEAIRKVLSGWAEEGWPLEIETATVAFEPIVSVA